MQISAIMILIAILLVFITQKSIKIGDKEKIEIKNLSLT